MRILVIFFLVCSLFLSSSVMLGALEWEPAQVVEAGDVVDASTPRIPFASARPAEPQVKLSDHEYPSDVFLWTDELGLRLEIVVHDAGFDPLSDTKWLWKGDCVYLEIDGLGDNPDSFAMGHDDVKLFFALAADGAHGKVSAHGHPHLKKDLNKELFAINFDAKEETFTYRICVPWNVLNTAPGLSTQCALALNVAHKGADKKDNVFGAMSNGRAKTRGLIPMVLEMPEKQLCLVKQFNEIPLLSSGASVRIPVFINDPHVQAVTMQMGSTQKTLPYVRGESLRGWVIVNSADLHVGNNVVIEIDGTQHACRFLSLHEQHAQIMQRLAASDLSNPVAAMHVESLQALATDCLSRAAILHHNDPDADNNNWLTKIFKWQEMLLQSLPATGFNLEQRLQTGKPLALAFVAEGDGSMQFATVQLPHDYDPKKVYPLVCYLHGYGPKKPVDYLVSLEDNSGQDTLWLGGSDEKVLQSAQRQCILLSPYGRGSTGYANLAEKDVWQACSIMHKHFKVDENRRYITGFSMGCDGAFRLASKQPDYWAAVNLSAGFYDRSSCFDEKHFNNVRQLPVIVWCGDKDKRMYSGLQTLEPIWEQAGLNPVHTTIAPDLPHTYPYCDFSAMLHECFKYKRSPVESFSYRLPIFDNSTWMPPACYGFQTFVSRGVVWETVEFSVTHKDNVFMLNTAPGSLAGFSVDPSAFENFAPSFDSAAEVTFTYQDTVLYQGMLQKTQRIRIPSAAEKEK